MERAYIVGAGQSPFGRHPGDSYRSLMLTAFKRAVDSVDAAWDCTIIDEVIIGTLGVGGRQVGLSAPAISSHLGLGSTPSSRIENACAAGGTAVRQGVLAVQAGVTDLVLAGGVEVMNDMSPKVMRRWLGVSGETEWERMAGTTFAGVYALMAEAHMEEFGTTKEQLAGVAVKNHRSAAANPDAHLRFECSVGDALEAPLVADPLGLYDCCPVTDGAAVVLIASEAMAYELTSRPVEVIGAGQAAGSVGVYDRSTLTSVPATVAAAARAYDQADVGPEDIDFAEVHDCFTIAEILAYEDLGFCAEGEGGQYLQSGATLPTGSLPVNRSGGLKAKGHPIGATGVAQVGELFTQLRSEAGPRQLSDINRGLAHNVGGSGGAAVVHILERAWA